jgi:hypothetical protein
MIGVILLVVILAVLIYFGIRGIQNMTGAQALFLTKAAMYTIISATLAMLLLVVVSTLNF